MVDSAVLSLLGTFLLSLIGLFAFIWSLRKGLLVENPTAAAVIFAPGELGKIDDPALSILARHPNVDPMRRAKSVAMCRRHSSTGA